MSSELYDVALRRLSSRNRTVKELTDYLLQRDFDAKKVKSLIDDFIKAGYLDDFQYCREYFRYSFSKGKGKNRVFRELKQKGVAEETVRLAYEEDEDGEYGTEIERARGEAKKILQGEELSFDDVISDKIRGRIARRLATKGYTADTIYTILGDMKR